MSNFETSSKRQRRKKTGEKQPEGDRLPPHSEEAEMGVLGCLLLAPEEGLNVCEERGVVAEWFYDLRHAHIFGAMNGLHAAGKGVDVITVLQALRDVGELDQVGGMPYLAALPDVVPSAANLRYYLETLEEKFLARAVVRAATAAVGEIYAVDGPEEGGGATVREVLARVERELLRLGEASVQERERHIREVLREVVNDLEDYHRGGAQMRGVSTGLDYLDKLLCGIGGDNGNMIVVAARPNTGKTSLVTQLLLHVALDYVRFVPVLNPPAEAGPVPGGSALNVPGGPRFNEEGKLVVERKQGMPVAFFSLEMASRAVGQRMLFQRAKGDLQRWRTGFATNADIAPLLNASKEMAKAGIYIDDTPRCTIESLRAKARRLHRQHGIGLFCIDYIQLMRSAERRFRQDRVQEMAEISGEIFALGKELGVPFVVLAQMNRDIEKSEKRRPPQLSDLKDCGSIEQDADVVGFLHRPKLSDEKEQEFHDQVAAAWRREPGNEGKEYKPDWSKHPMLVDFIVEKARYGPTGPARLIFHRASTRFEDYHQWQVQSGNKQASLGEGSKYSREVTAEDRAEADEQSRRRYAAAEQGELGD